MSDADKKREAHARAFNLGCDARIAGIYTDKNPYKADASEHKHWLYGWQDVEHWWGRNAVNPMRLPRAARKQATNRVDEGRPLRLLRGLKLRGDR